MNAREIYLCICFLTSPDYPLTPVPYAYILVGGKDQKPLKAVYWTPSLCKQQQANSVGLERQIQIRSRTAGLIKAILPSVRVKESAVFIMIISSNILLDSSTKKHKLNRTMPLVNEVVSQAALLITT